MSQREPGGSRRPRHETEQQRAHETQREIWQQPRLWRQVRRDLDQRHPATRQWVTALLARPELRIVLAGAGTSAYVGEVAAPHLRRALKRRVEAVATTDLVSAPYSVLAEELPTLVVSVARSGNSPESVAATAIADQVLGECYHLVVTCDPEGRLAAAHGRRDDSRVVAMPPAANDQGLAMTSSFTCMVLAVLMLLDTPEDAGDLVERLAVAGQAVLDTRLDAVRELVDTQPSGLVYLGGPSLHGLARESALKVIELTAGAVPSASETTLGFRHGPKAMLSQQPAVIVYVSNDPYSRLFDLDMLSEIGAEHGQAAVVAVASRADGIPAETQLWLVPGVEDVPDAYLALPAVLHAQLLGVTWSLALGLNPDNPFPSGEVNRVVQGVTVHPLTRRERP